MVRKARKKQTTPAQMYKHFAVVTVVITAAVGILADGEAQQAIVKHQQEKAEKKRIANAQALNNGNRRLISEGESDEGGGSFGSDISMGGGGGSGYSSSTAERIPFKGENRSVISNTPIWERVGLRKEDWDKLSDEQKQEIAQKRDPLYGKSEAEQRADLRRMAEQARIRAGGRSNGANSDAPTDEPF